jgi:23S rRNA pseudouridine2605 synthase
VNGTIATVGDQLDPLADRVTVDGKLVSLSAHRTYVLMNKPAGVLTAASDDRGRQTVVGRLDPGLGRLFPVGRLDMHSRGLLLLTDDGDVAMRLMHPRYHVEKEYRVVISSRPGAQAMRRLQEGMVIGTERFAPIEVELLEGGDERSLVRMVLQEGRKREVRRLWQALGHRVLDLERIRMGPLKLGSLASGATRELTGREVAAVRASVGLE